MDAGGMVSDAEVISGRAKPLGMYPHYRRAGDLIFVSGTSSRRADNTFVGAEPDGSGGIVFDILEQTRAVIRNIAGILDAAGASLSDLVELSTFLVDMDDFDGYNEAYSEFFDESGPARTTVAVHQLPEPHIIIEIRATAYWPVENQE
ncbi:MAG: RidA family protein [Acidimicrobiales bacterium]|jgi:2-aminomuconate deaminase|nr:RidA family protein [Acidimicrobiales bacterium]MDP7410387.1 RidA family protein [Acidimicrobiales bacterium]|tara:strand:+ start:96 stop:539 length:444 start_codon:yes stop_codon:yes gene_type:complete